LITVSNLSLSFGGDTLFKDVDLLFTAGNCYGVIGANGAGKSTFLKILNGDLEPSTGHISIPANLRMSVLKQDHFAFDAFTVEKTVIMGNKRLYDVMIEKDALYEKADFTDEDGEKASELEGEFAELGGWEAESDASRLVQGLGLPEEILQKEMSALTGNEKVKVLLAQSLFGNPDIILLDEPTNHLDIDAVAWLEDFLADYFGTVIVVSHDRHFLNNVCTHIVDIDYGKIRMYIGNYEFWYESSQLIQRLLKQQNKRAEDKIKELQSFIQRFSANKSKSRQATSRKKLIEKITPEEMPASSRKYPFIGFDPEREAGKDILTVNNLCWATDGVKYTCDLTVNKGDKIAFLAENEQIVTMFFRIIMEESTPLSGSFKWGQTITKSYFPLDNNAFFDGHNENILDWMRPYSKDQTETYLRGFLGRMLFSGDDVYKPVNVLSGGERVRCMFSRMMLFGSNLLVLDQPTNHLDLESITAVNNGLRDFKGTVLFTSHDRETVGTAATRIVEFTEQGVIDYAGNYEDYVQWRKQQNLGVQVL
jgi:ATPase subunit of ABC transporter with duplicated ATPase domains